MIRQMITFRGEQIEQLDWRRFSLRTSAAEVSPDDKIPRRAIRMAEILAADVRAEVSPDDYIPRRAIRVAEILAADVRRR